MEYEASRILMGVNWCCSLNWKWVTVIYSSQGCGPYCWFSFFPRCLLISKSKCSEFANVLTRPFCVFPCSCCEIVLTPIQWEWTVFVIDHSCGSEKNEMRLKIYSRGAAEEANREITLLKTAIKINIIVENLINDFLIQSLVPFSFELWLLKSFPKHIGVFLSVQADKTLLTSWLLLPVWPFKHRVYFPAAIQRCTEMPSLSLCCHLFSLEKRVD